MASAFGHAMGAMALGTAFRQTAGGWKFWLLGIIASVLPDTDVLAFAFGIPYESIWGHRGISHSILAALAIGTGMTWLFYSGKPWNLRRALITYFFLCALSHSLLDMLTNGGLGVAIFAPFENNRHFFDWRPIQVSPIGVGNFFTARGWRVIQSEAVWIGIPCMLFSMLMLLRTQKKQDRTGS